MNWSDYSNVADHSTDCLLDFFSNYGFVQFVNQPTRISHSGRGNILDAVLSTDQFAIRVNEVGIPFITSDHCTVDFLILLLLLHLITHPTKCYTNSKVRAPSEKTNSEQVRL